jgi:hypothetical protein
MKTGAYVTVMNEKFSSRKGLGFGWVFPGIGLLKTVQYLYHAHFSKRES